MTETKKGKKDNVEALPTTTGDYEVRSLRNGDIFRAARIIAAVTNDGRLYNPGVMGTQHGMYMAVAGAAMEQAPQELEKFLADLVNMKVESFQKLPFDATPDILFQLMEGDDFEGFYNSVLKLSGAAKKVFGGSPTSSENGSEGSQTTS